MAANIAGHYMAKGKRVLITSKSPKALDVIRDKIAGKDGVFTEGNDLQNVVISWGDQKEAYRRFSAAVEILQDLAVADVGEDQHNDEMEKSREKVKRHSGYIEKIENSLRDRSLVAYESLERIAETAGGSQIRMLASVISEMCDVKDSLREIKNKNPRQLAERIQIAHKAEGPVSNASPRFPSFVSFVEKDLIKVLEDESKRQQLLTWFKTRPLHSKAATQREQSTPSKAKEDTKDANKRSWTAGWVSQKWMAAASKFLGSPARAGAQAPEISEKDSESNEPMCTLQDAVEKWEQEDHNPAAPTTWQLYIVLLSCKIFLKKLKEGLEPCASMHHEDITARESFEQERRVELKEMVGKETLRYLVSRYKSKDDWFHRDLKDFVGLYREASKLKGKASKINPKTIKIQDRLSKLFEKDASDGRPAYLMDALPIWIMPTDLVSEMLPAKLGLFDLVILEEASQSDCGALPALLRGRQLVIIGDDKQVNPPKSHEDYKMMIVEKLGNDLPSDTRDNLLPGKSIFDLFSIVFNGPDTIVRLREHFRCLPEIIGFSNELCYDNRLIPMRESKPGFGPAIQMQFVEDASSTPGSNPKNEKEAHAIVESVRKLLEEDHSTDKKRSIGIISLWHTNQAKLINEMLEQDDYIVDRREFHDIQCGDAREFQGDEKDIILLSLVIGTERRAASDDEAIFNVAVSRARYSVRLFHSVKVGDLKDGDVRKKLLKYFQKYCHRSRNSKQSVLGEFKVLMHLTDKLEQKGYTVNPINVKKQAFMIQVGSNSCEASCVFVFLGAFRDCQKEQDICYMLSRLERSWQAIWLFHAIVRPDQCLEEMELCLQRNKVVALPSTPSKQPDHHQQQHIVDSMSERENSQESGGNEESDSDSVADHAQKKRTDAAAQITAQPGSALSGGGGRAEAVPSPGAGAGVAFSSQHLADVLCAAFSTMQAMKGCVQDVQSKSEAFKTVKRSSKADGQYSKEQIAASICQCRPVSVTNAQELLYWLKDKKVLGRAHLRAAMDMLVPPIKYKQADTIEVLGQKIVEGMRTRKVAGSSEGEKSKERGGGGGSQAAADNDEVGAKRADHDDHAVSCSQKRIKPQVQVRGAAPRMYINDDKDKSEDPSTAVGSAGAAAVRGQLVCPSGEGGGARAEMVTTSGHGGGDSTFSSQHLSVAASASTSRGALGDAAPSSGLQKSEDAGETHESGGGSVATHEKKRQAEASPWLDESQEAGMKRRLGAAASAAVAELSKRPRNDDNTSTAQVAAPNDDGEMEEDVTEASPVLLTSCGQDRRAEEPHGSTPEGVERAGEVRRKWAVLRFGEGQEVFLSNLPETWFCIGSFRNGCPDEDCHRVTDPKLVQFYLTMRGTTEGATLEDTSTNGTWINDSDKMRKNDRKELKDGDSVKLYSSETQATPESAIFSFHICRTLP